MGTVVRTSQAERDIVGIALFIAQNNPSAADRFLDALDEKFALLATHPEMGEPRPELASDLRTFSEGNYVIYFRPTADGIEVARVLHGARDIETLF